MQIQTNGIQLPASFQQVDGTYFNGALPQQNDVFPQIQFMPGANTQTIAYAISLFRTYAQTRAEKSPIHCFTYNLLQMNRFQNQLFTGWCQLVADLCDFLERGQQVQSAVAADKAASRIYQVLMANLCQQYPAIQQYLDQPTLNGLTDAARLGQNISNDITQFKARLQGGVGVGQQQGMVNQGQFNHSQHVNSFAVQGVGQPNAGYNNPSAPSSSDGLSGMLLGTTAPVAKPTSSWSGGVQTPVTQAPPAQVNAKPVETGIVEHDMRAPATASDVVVDPNHYIPKGHTIDPARPYDNIRNPGGVVVRPAHLAKDWKVTPGDDSIYPRVYNPQTHIRFLAKWVDGVVKEVIVPYGPEMDYLKHEINDALRSKAMRPKGIVVPLPKYSQTADMTVMTTEWAKLAMVEQSTPPELLSPVVLDDLITGSTDLENEAIARSIVVESLGLNPDDCVPCHEYETAKMYQMDISEACFKALHRFAEFKTPTDVVENLKALLQNGILPLRYYNFIVKRLTQGVNDLLRDALSIQGIRIDDFVEDAIDLGPYLRNKKGPEFEQVYLGNIQSIVLRSMSVVEENVEEGEEPRVGIVDEYLNFQLGIASDELSNLNLTDEACVVSPISHPIIIAALRAMRDRAEQKGALNRVRMRLISSDGFYYEVIVGKLVKGALLLKRV